MLLRMYMRWAERKGFKLRGARPAARRRGRHQERDHRRRRASGPTAGCAPRRACTGWCASRRSTRNARRHTSFASVFVYPDIDETIKVEIDEKDLRIDVMRSGGAGGQHVNKTESAVRVTHIPTGIAVHSDGERSQHKNRSTAMRILRSKLFEVEAEEAGREDGQHPRPEEGDRVGEPDPVVRAGALPAGHRPPHRAQGQQRRRASWTATWISSWSRCCWSWRATPRRRPVGGARTKPDDDERVDSSPNLHNAHTCG